MKSGAGMVVVVGTSLQVYPAAGLIHAASPFAPKYIIDPFIPDVRGVSQMHAIGRGASAGLEELKELIHKFV